MNYTKSVFDKGHSFSIHESSSYLPTVQKTLDRERGSKGNEGPTQEVKLVNKRTDDEKTNKTRYDMGGVGGGMDGRKK